MQYCPWWGLFLAGWLAFTASAATSTNKPPAAPDLTTEGNIGMLVSQILERTHFLHHKFDDDVSVKFLKRYLDTLDGQHLYLLESDVQEFNEYRTILDELTAKKADSTPAHRIFKRFLERFETCVQHMDDLLKNETFTFTGDDRYQIKRDEAPRPKDLTEAHQLWRLRLRYEYLQEKLNKKPPEEIVKTLSNRYHRQLRTLKDYGPEEVHELYLTSLSRVFDPHSDYMGHSQLENFNIGMKLSLFGIGAQLSSIDGYCVIQSLVPEGPAEKSKKIKAGDKIVAVAQGDKPTVDVVDMPLNKIVEQIRGPKGTPVKLVILPTDASDPSVRKVVTLIRDEIKLKDQEAKAQIVDVPAGDGRSVRVGIIDLPSFYAEMDSRRQGRKSTTTDVARLLKKLKQEKVQGVVLDLRRNGGGSLEEAINLTGLFITKGPVVQQKDYEGNITVDADPDPHILYDGPLIILTSRFSASASEILAGALQDYDRALIVGDSCTHGKGTVQQLIQLEPMMQNNKLTYRYNPGGIKITIRKFYRASGASTQLKGVTPDIILPSVNNVLEVGEASLDNPMPWDEIQSARYERLNRVRPFLSTLKEKSEARVQQDQEFDYIREDIDLYQKVKAEKSVSLNEEARRKETKDNEDRAEVRKKERLSRVEPEQFLYEINLKNADLPALPPPTLKTNYTFVVKESTNQVRSATNGLGTLPANHPPVAGKNTSDTTKSSEIEDPDLKDAKPAAETAEEREKVPVVDPTLDETEHILLHYIQLLTRKPAPTTTVTE